MCRLELKRAVLLAMQDCWQAAHEIAQNETSPMAYWLHAALHKIEGDKANSLYWYAKTEGRRYEDFNDTMTELEAISCDLDGHLM